mgnify:CR=1 FL=1
MIRIAILDDEKADLEKEEQITRQYFYNRQAESEIATYQSVEWFLLGLTEEQVKEKFGFFVDAFKFGAPPHGGLAFGFDRLCSLFGGSESIRDYIAFPKNNNGRDMMLDAPGYIDQAQLDELHIQLVKPEE